MTKLEKIYKVLEKYNESSYWVLEDAYTLQLVDSYHYALVHKLYIDEKDDDIYVHASMSKEELYGDLTVLLHDSDSLANFSKYYNNLYSHFNNDVEFKSIDEIIDILQSKDKDGLIYDISEYLADKYNYYFGYCDTLNAVLDDDFTNYRGGAAYHAINFIQNQFDKCKKEIKDILHE